MPIWSVLTINSVDMIPAKQRKNKDIITQPVVRPSRKNCQTLLSDKTSINAYLSKVAAAICVQSPRITLYYFTDLYNKRPEKKTLNEYFTEKRQVSTRYLYCTMPLSVFGFRDHYTSVIVCKLREL